MLHDLKIDELLDKVDSRYGLAVASAKRARQINEYTSTPPTMPSASLARRSTPDPSIR